MYAKRLLLVLLLAPTLIAAAPMIVADVDPDFQELLDEEPPSSNSKTSTKALRRFFFPDDGNSKENNIPLDYILELDQIHTNEVDSPRATEDKRSGLRAAMLARGGRGMKFRTGWQVGGSPIDVVASGQESGNSYITRRSQQPASPSTFLGAVNRGIPLRGQRISNANAVPAYSPGILSNVDNYFGDLQSGIGDYTDDELALLGIRKVKPIITDDSYSHGGAMLRPSDKVRLFVQDRGPLALRGANGHDPALLWTGVGRR